ncbi:hypothetical protein CDAR_40431 [Caerostris darwini]|uniref:Uncharacterized protein n=1 Tax=Caerostris darwini TaxID=1538125 RepID=A0AAV4RCM1_9ARAC|nr:hypothetical protein CDAR_40431 [Caerostris darwini]
MKKEERNPDFLPPAHSNPETHSRVCGRTGTGGVGPGAIWPLSAFNAKSSNHAHKKVLSRKANTWARGCRPAATCEIVPAVGPPLPCWDPIVRGLFIAPPPMKKKSLRHPHGKYHLPDVQRVPYAFSPSLPGFHSFVGIIKVIFFLPYPHFY